VVLPNNQEMRSVERDPWQALQTRSEAVDGNPGRIEDGAVIHACSADMGLGLVVLPDDKIISTAERNVRSIAASNRHSRSIGDGSGLRDARTHDYSSGIPHDHESGAI